MSNSEPNSESNSQNRNVDSSSRISQTLCCCLQKDQYYVWLMRTFSTCRRSAFDIDERTIRAQALVVIGRSPVALSFRSLNWWRTSRVAASGWRHSIRRRRRQRNKRTSQVSRCTFVADTFLPRAQQITKITKHHIQDGSFSTV